MFLERVPDSSLSAGVSVQVCGKSQAAQGAKNGEMVGLHTTAVAAARRCLTRQTSPPGQRKRKVRHLDGSERSGGSAFSDSGTLKIRFFFPRHFGFRFRFFNLLFGRIRGVQDGSRNTKLNLSVRPNEYFQFELGHCSAFPHFIG